MEFAAWLDTAWTCGVPLLAVETNEQLWDAQRVVAWAQGRKMVHAQWERLGGVIGEAGSVVNTEQPERFVAWLQGVGEGIVIVAQWQAAFWSSPSVVQGVLNLREHYKSDGSMLILVGQQMQLPAVLVGSFLTWEMSLPGTEELTEIVQQVGQNGFAALGHEGVLENVGDIVAACQGMGRFATEQHCSMAWTDGGIDVGQVWASKVALINDTPGLQCWQGEEKMSDLRGLDGFVRDMRALANGRLPVRLVVWVDESEDTFAGVTGDTSGISQDYLGVLSKHIQDTRAQSILLAGQPGTGKSFAAKAAGSFFGCLVLALDLGACKGGLVGQSEQQLRRALAVERAIVGHELGSTLWVWTSNNPGAIPAKMRARNQAEYFFDLPGEQEALSIWSLHRGRYEIDPGEAFPQECDGWTGREIERCCRLAWQYRCSLIEAGRRIVPIRLSQGEEISARRKASSGRFISPVTGEVFLSERAEGKRKVRPS